MELTAISNLSRQTLTYNTGINLSQEVKKQLDDQKLKATCREFESMLHYSMLQAMRKTIDKSDLFYGGNAEDIFTSMLDEEYAKIMSNSNKGTIAESLYQQLAQKQHIQNTQLHKPTEGVRTDINKP